MKIKTKINKLDLIKVKKNIFIAKKIISKTKWQSSVWEKIFSKGTNKILISKKHKSSCISITTTTKKTVKKK